MKARKWISEKHHYEDCEISDNCSLFETDMDKEVECVCCGKKVKYGDTYVSKIYHNRVGLGYAECEKCYFKMGENKRQWNL